MAVIFRRRQEQIEPVIEQKPVEIGYVASSVGELVAKKEYENYLHEVALERPIGVVPSEDQEPTEVRRAATGQHAHDRYGHDIFLIDKKEHLTKRSQYLNDLLTFENK